MRIWVVLACSLTVGCGSAVETGAETEDDDDDELCRDGSLVDAANQVVHTGNLDVDNCVDAGVREQANFRQLSERLFWSCANLVSALDAPYSKTGGGFVTTGLMLEACTAAQSTLDAFLAEHPSITCGKECFGDSTCSSESLEDTDLLVMLNGVVVEYRQALCDVAGYCSFANEYMNACVHTTEPSDYSEGEQRCFENGQKLLSRNVESCTELQSVWFEPPR